MSLLFVKIFFTRLLENSSLLRILNRRSLTQKIDLPSPPLAF